MLRCDVALTTVTCAASRCVHILLQHLTCVLLCDYNLVKSWQSCLQRGASSECLMTCVFGVTAAQCVCAWLCLGRRQKIGGCTCLCSADGKHNELQCVKAED
eukprot:GHUV01019839.1.p1 GENE.GHUV01019839.1~~GHUV01019839.1.p1  ORF type:complete len:102 (+),score=22.03 GHUV01019839.1:683-988(+)